MGKLAEMVSEDVSILDRVKINARRVHLARIGLFSKVDSERLRLYKQMMEMGESYGFQDSLLGRLSLVGTGAVNLVLEETQRVFDDLVEEGERALARGKPKVTLAADKIAKARPVAKAKPITNLVSKSGSKSGSKPVAKRVDAKARAEKPRLPDVIRQRFDAARKQAARSNDASEQVARDLLALEKQITEGDVKGRRPAQAKIRERAEFDARKELKGMALEDAVSRYESLVESLTLEPAG